jgi:hypothetical protein
MTPEIRKLQSCVDGLLHIENESSRFAKMQPRLRKAVESAVSLFDCQHLPKLLAEHKRLAGGDGTSSDADVSPFFLRTVLREAIAATNMANFVDSDSGLELSSTVTIPYSYRDTTAAGTGDTRVYEGQEIPRSGIKQGAEMAYPIPQKLAFSFSDEMRLLTQGGFGNNFDVIQENLKNLVKILGEDTNQATGNEMLQASDEYGAVPVLNEDLQPKTGGGKRVFTLAHFPVVRPRKHFDLQGSQVGNTINPITVDYNAVTLDEYDGTGEQPIGTYYVIDYNLGEIYLVDESGALLTPTLAWTISYSYSTNVFNWDSDLGASEIEERWDNFLYRFKLRKSLLEDQRYTPPDFSLLSGTLQGAVEQAKSFAEQHKKRGTSLDEAGSLYSLSCVPVFKTQGLGLWYLDHRVLIGQKGTTKLRFVRPLEVSRLENERGPTGRFTGKKAAYATQWIVVHTPTQLKGQYTSLNVYSASLRIDRANP